VRQRRSAARAPEASPYTFPFLSSSWGRIDQGVDFTGHGPILAIGRAKILRTGAPGWPEGGGVLYELLEGPLKGKVIFTYEGVDVPHWLKPGMIVRKGQPIATFRPGGSIETGLADRSGVPISHTEYEGMEDGTPTKGGNLFHRLLKGIEKRTPPAALGHIASAPNFLEQVGEQITHPGQTAGEDLGLAGAAAGGAASALAEGLFSLFGDHAEAFALNLALLGGGAFLIYYGTTKVLGVQHPVGSPAKLAAAAAK
jgi:hypothetical protein